MEPYSSKEDGLKGFGIALIGLLMHLPIEHNLDPEIHATELFLQSLGCIGNLKNILSNALLKALQRKVPLTIPIVRECYFTAAQLNVMKDELNEGIPRVRKLMTLESLAETTAQSKPTEPTHGAPQKKRKLAPGETVPSHRTESTKNWDKL